MNHKWENDRCVLCDMTVNEYLNSPSWDAAFCPKAQQPPLKKQTCCSIPAIVYLGGRWFCENCGAPDTDLNSRPKAHSAKCTCGAIKIYGENTPGHYNDCEIRRRK